MPKYKITTTKKFDKAYDKLKTEDKELVKTIIQKIADGKTLEPKYKDHKLKGALKDFRDCHIKPDLVLIYKLNKDILILNAFNIGSHSEIF